MKKRRLKVLVREHPDLLARLDETGLVLAHHSGASTYDPSLGLVDLEHEP